MNIGDLFTQQIKEDLFVYFEVKKDVETKYGMCLGYYIDNEDHFIFCNYDEDMNITYIETIGESVQSFINPDVRAFLEQKIGLTFGPMEGNQVEYVWNLIKNYE